MISVPISLAPTLALALPVAIIPLLFLLHRHIQQQLHQKNLQLLQQMKLLRQLIGGFQRHRGLSNGLLCGDTSLHEPLRTTRAELDHLMATATNTDAGSHLDTWRHLADHWSRLREGRTLDANNNLAQHHLIIRSSIFLLEDLAYETRLSENKPDLAWLPLIWHEVLQTAEWAGQARALGTGMAAAGHNSAEQRIRLRFLYQKIHLLSTLAFRSLRTEFDQHLPAALLPLQQAEHQVSNLLNCIQQELLTDQPLTISAGDYFQQATLAIESLLTLVDLTLDHLQQALH
ncbi:nitrate- and nitrite sensing domain-containing protein [Marinospirillum alkaliphilum]|uniref:Nitrate and nitrite sensing n=1 Tax=Marinospirillum alkaliphilum DSM 21637 TaxID=1122209 RepID=A0A1K1W3C8_9GAMM|nr:nitrate- and nitrite sensing domain-containing protein [Marinospirillum alkaliphilum]SFX31902.1 Nitrate and nitrite sensing [Marinospirillum alkaliphilum DSM 21637]